MGFSSLASAFLIHVLKTHRLETKISRDFYVRRILPLGFLMARHSVPAASVLTRERAPDTPCMASGFDARFRKPGVPVPERELHSDPQGRDARAHHARACGGPPGEAKHAGAAPHRGVLTRFSRQFAHMPRAQVTIAVSIIAVGTAISSWGELAFSMLGFVIMMTSGAPNGALTPFEFNT